MKIAFEREKFSAEMRIREREIEIQERRIALEEKDKSALSWRSPLVLAIVGATLAAFGNVVAVYLNGENQREMEVAKSEAALVLEAIKTGDPDAAAENLEFMIDTGLIARREQLATYLANRDSGSGASLPAQSSEYIFGKGLQSLIDMSASEPRIVLRRQDLIQMHESMMQSGAFQNNDLVVAFVESAIAAMETMDAPGVEFARESCTGLLLDSNGNQISELTPVSPALFPPGTTCATIWSYLGAVFVGGLPGSSLAR